MDCQLIYLYNKQMAKICGPPGVDHSRLTYLQFMIKPTLFIQYLDALVSGLQIERIPYIFGSLSQTMFGWVGRQPATKPLKDLVVEVPRIRRLFALLLMIGHRVGVSLDYFVGFKDNSREFIDLYEEHLLPYLSQEKVGNATAIFKYFRFKYPVQRLKQNQLRVEQYELDWIAQDLTGLLGARDVETRVKEAFIELVREATTIAKHPIPRELKSLIGSKDEGQMCIQTESLDKNSRQIRGASEPTRMTRMLEEAKLFPLPSILASLDPSSKVKFLEEKFENIFQLTGKVSKYKSYIQQILQEPGQTSKAQLYNMALCIRILEFSVGEPANVFVEFISEIEYLFREIQTIQQQSIKHVLRLMASLTYLQNFLPAEMYAIFLRFLSGVISTCDKQNDKKSKSVLVLFHFSFNLRENGSSAKINFNMFWRHVLDNRYFTRNICSVRFIDYLIGFNCLVMEKARDPELFKDHPCGLTYKQVFEKELQGINYAQIDINQQLPFTQIVELLDRKRVLSSRLKNGKDIESTIQMAKYLAVSSKNVPYAQCQLAISSASFAGKLSQLDNLDLDPVLFKILIGMLFQKRMYTLTLIACKLFEQAEVPMLVRLLQSIQRTKERVDPACLSFCTPDLLKILLSYCERTDNRTVSEAIINKLKETNKYQYNNASKIQKLLTQGQSEFVKFVCCLLSQK